jgi:CheY-like chemotaxis protein
MTKIKSAVLIDCNDIDNFINRKILENYGATNVIVFKCANNALSYLKETSIKYQRILIDIHLPVMDGFEFIDKFYELDLHKTQGKICILSASINPLHKEKSEEKKIKFIDKPLTIEKLFVK